ncbi:MAG: ATP synthase F1 subunit delta [Bacteroides sp.]|nr:ATP synthase F1 subunit delta [Bacteroides sp.]MCM1378800.1 ATP synthase F1 subunit delta [Bacteroides sp.]MCM1445417.1 ATP synthase F1 subunit delta [Prevotella sp.]
MNQGLIPRRYAKALYLLAAENGKDKEVYGAMNNLNAAFGSHNDMLKVLANPHVAFSDKLALAEAAAGEDAKTYVADLMKLLDRNHRLEFLREIALAYIAIYREEHHIYKVDITSAMELQPAELKRIQTLVNNHLPAGSTAEFTETVNPELIGGFSVSIDNELLDASIASDFKQLRLKLLSH